MLSFKLLGRTVLFQNDRPLSQFRSQKEAALLIYLAHTGQAHSRAFLAELFWESSSTKQSLNNLRTAVSRLRKQVGEALLVTRQEVGLTAENRQAVDSVALLQALTDMAHIDTAEKAATLRQALDTYQGEFLADFDLSNAPQFDDWVAQTRAHIHHQVIAAYHKLGQYTLAQRETTQGFQVAHRWLQVDPLNEMAHTLLIRLHLKAGNVQEAIAHYQHFVELLDKELGLAPPVAVTVLIENAQAQRTRPTHPIVRATPTAVRNNLPAVHDQFFGRQTIQTEIHARLDQPWCRLVTLVGQGGVGKTRLALTVARSRLRQYPDGVWFVDLTHIDPHDEDVSEAIAVEIATILDLRLTGSATPQAQLLDHLQHKQTLLLLDNFEHLLGEGFQIVQAIAERCELVQMLVTSREALKIRAEWTITLTGLTYSVSDLDEQPTDAMALFVARRAQQKHDPVEADDLAAMRTICRTVEGLPLAIELAAALTRHTPVSLIAERLQDGFEALQPTMRDMPERHQGLQVVFEMSWRTLSPLLQVRLSRLAVFRGGFTAVAAQEITDSNEAQLAALVEKSLIVYDETAQRYRLHPVVQAYALGELPEHDRTREEHGRYYLQLLANHAEPLQKERPQDSMALLEPEIDNVRQAWQTGLAGQETALLTAALPALSVYYQLRSVAREAVTVMRQTMNTAVVWGTEGTHLAARAGLERARFQNRLSRHRPAIKTLKAVLAWTQASGDRWAEGMGLVWWGEALWRLSEYDAAREKLQAAMTIGESLDDAAIEGWSHHQLGIVNDIQGRYDEAQTHLEQACVRWRKLSNAQCLSNSLNSLGIVRYHRGDYARAQEVMSEALALCNELGNRHVQMALLNNLSNLSTEQKDYAGAQYYKQLCLQFAISTGNLSQQADALINLGSSYCLQGDWDAAREYLQRGLALAESIDSFPNVAIALEKLGEVSRLQGALSEAEILYQQALALAQKNHLQRLECLILLELTELWRDIDKERAYASSQQALRLAEEMQNPRVLEQAHELVRRLAMQDDMA